MHISYTKQAANAVRYAAKKAKEMKHPYIGTEHLLLGLREEFSGVAGQVLAQNGVETEKIMQLMDELIAPREEMPASQKPKESPRLRRKNFDHAEYQPSKTFKRYFKCIGSRSERLSG